MMKCFLDMDGVLSDFVGGICKAHGLASPYTNPEALGKFDMEGLWGMTIEKFWAPSNSDEFWFNLDKTAEADQIVDMVSRKFGVENIAILTSPSLWRGCVTAKRDWINKYYPQLSKRMIFAWAKGFMASPQRVLIDDRDRNVDDFEAEGGKGILVPRLWNRRFPFIIDDYRSLNSMSIKIIKQGLEAIHVN